MAVKGHFIFPIRAHVRGAFLKNLQKTVPFLGGTYAIITELKFSPERRTGYAGAAGKRTLRIAICDDSPLMLERLRDLVQQVLSPEWQISIICDTSPQKLLSNRLAFQIAMLDIQLLDNSGINMPAAKSAFFRYLRETV